MCWDVPGARQFNGARLQLWDCNDVRAAQAFVFTDYDGGTIRTVVRDGTYGWKLNLCVDAPTNTDRISLWTCNNGATERFDDDDDDFDLTVYNGSCSAVQGSVFRRGQALNRQDCEGDEVRFEVEQL